MKYNLEIKSCHLYLGFLLLTQFVACKKTAQPTNQEADPSAIDLPSTELDGKENLLNSGVYCYQYIMNRDTYSLNFAIEGNQLAGEMMFNNYEIDRSRGEIRGMINEDIISLDYRFNSEGMTSIRNMQFKVRGNLLINGTGNEEAVGDSAFIRDKSSIQYDGLVYHAVDCK